METVNPSIERIKPGEYRDGARGLNLGAPVPHGAVGYNKFAPGQKAKKAPSPLERPSAKKAIRSATEWFNNYLLKTRGAGLKADESVPKFILLVHALELQEPERNDCLKCLEHMQVPLATKYPITVEWGYQEFFSVPYEVRTYPLHVAISIIDLCRTNIYADMPLWDEQNQKVVSRLLTDEERVSISYKKFREPQPHELPQAQEDYGVSDLANRTVKIEGGSGDLLMDLNPGGGDPLERVAGNDPTAGTVHSGDTTPFPTPAFPQSRVSNNPHEHEAGAGNVADDVAAAAAAARHMAGASGMEVTTPGLPSVEGGPAAAPEGVTTPPAPGAPPAAPSQE